MLKSSLIATISPIALSTQIVTEEGIRITVLTEKLFRVEFDRYNTFQDEATQSVWFRSLTPVAFDYSFLNGVSLVKTASATLSVNVKSKKIYVLLKGENKFKRADNRENLLGTRRTLDFTNGRVSIKKGLISKRGVAVYDDSDTLLLDGNGEIKERKIKEKDIYVFAHGDNYREAINDFYKISGQVPLIPRFALGVWWSRYRKYSEQEYLTLMDEFSENNIPLTVATVDMDWHWVDLKKQFPDRKYPFGRKGLLMWTPGWTGYSWNTDLFPDYKRFLKALHDRNLKVTLNVHPADGVRDFEDMYEKMATKMDVDPATRQKIPFSASDPKFLNNYFDILHKPYEKDGVDFWWLDWQQGKISEIPSLDPLWALNHYHYLDNAEGEKSPLILSRYAGVGSHRYPLGFSGDTSITWATLDFQPYFTANAANVGYTWWSHDIGGHHFGARDDELYLRWLQFGVFSPIMRLHSTSNDLLGKEPWNYPSQIAGFASDALRFRHKLIPYLDTMNYRTHKDGIALCEPMYYSYPKNPEAYTVGNEYMFGSELIVAPITRPSDSSINLAGTKVWMPEGRWTDIFTDTVYIGNRTLTMFRDYKSIPILAKEGAIIPLSLNEVNGADDPDNLEIYIYRGNNVFDMVDRNGDGRDVNAFTRYEVSESDDIITFKISAFGDLKSIPKKRSFKLNFKDIYSAKTISVKLNSEIIEEKVLIPSQYKKEKIIIFSELSPTDVLEITLKGYETLKPPKKEFITEQIFARWQENNIYKTHVYKGIMRGKSPSGNIPPSVKKILEYADTLESARD